MKFMIMHKSDAQMEAGGPPPTEIIQEMGKFIRGAIDRGEFVNGAGLHRSALRARVRISGGTRTVQRGPFSGENELIASFAMIQAPSIDHAIDVATQIAGAVGDAEIEVGRVVEPWDLGVMEKPANAPERYLLLRKADQAFEAGQAAPAGLAKLLAQFERDGAVDASATLAPSSAGARYRKTAAGRAWTDGPFAESKELVAGFSIVELPSMHEARTWTEAYARILGNNEVDVRPVV